ncbi:hypothetical protein HYALB_00007373 [Hymenoscyphus albidus]|uniref:SGNH hydrolase-type esterase domain-containing protein n=1 Tax=Hymenoscyphus albidus TaxID=595503 RepID=A0A9N9LF38_9HELO|nr:hypothetical protein HYALB_00007373 [Hymenoscyphus albidus]
MNIFPNIIPEARPQMNHHQARFYTNDTDDCNCDDNGTALRILPLGDSITFGLGEASGNSYRRDLECMLFADGYGVQYIGSLESGDWPDRKNDGFSGQRIAEIGTMADVDLRGPLLPNVVLVHAGSNDINSDFDLDNAPKRVGELVDRIHTALPEALIIVARITGETNEVFQNRIEMFNDGVQEVVEAKANASIPVRLVSMDAVDPVNDTIDGLHPNERGYTKMAVAWFDAIEDADDEGLIMPVTGDFEDGGPFAC